MMHAVKTPRNVFISGKSQRQESKTMCVSIRKNARLPKGGEHCQVDRQIPNGGLMLVGRSSCANRSPSHERTFSEHPVNERISVYAFPGGRESEQDRER